MPRRKVFLISPPYKGHLHPMLGVARRLAAVADVTVCSTAEGVQAAVVAGVPGREIMAGYEADVRAISEPGYNVRNNPVRLYRQFKANVGLMAALKAELAAVYQAERPDLVIADFAVPVAGLAAEAQGIPWWTLLASPCVLETPDGPPAYFGGQTPPTTRYQHLKQAAMRHATRRFKKLLGGLFRRPLRALGLAQVYRPDGTEAMYSPACILALSVPALEFPATYPPQVRLVGPVLYTPPYDGPEPVFYADGRSHVLVTLGTHLPHARAALAAVVQGLAARHPAIVFHLVQGPAGPAADAAVRPGNLHTYPYLSYADHLPRYDVVVHHAGAGVMHYCLRHAKPSVVHPLDYDQFDNAARMVAAGVAVAARRLADLEGAVLQALADPVLREACQAMQQHYLRSDAPSTIARLVREAVG